MIWFGPKMEPDNNWEDDFEYYPSGSSQRESWRHRVYKLRELRGNRCEICHQEEEFDKKGASNLEFAHVKKTKINGRSRGQTQRFKDIIRNPEAYKLVCKSCHKEIGDPKE